MSLNVVLISNVNFPIEDTSRHSVQKDCLAKSVRVRSRGFYGIPVFDTAF